MSENLHVQNQSLWCYPIKIWTEDGLKVDKNKMLGCHKIM